MSRTKFTYMINPVSKPRMTQRDKWLRRPCTENYWQFKDECRIHQMIIPAQSAHITFHVPMPKSWSKTKRAQYRGKPHQQKPDTDNFLKAILDAVYNDDSTVWDIRATKRWAEEGMIAIEADERDILNSRAEHTRQLSGRNPDGGESAI